MFYFSILARVQSFYLGYAEYVGKNISNQSTATKRFQQNLVTEYICYDFRKKCNVGIDEYGGIYGTIWKNYIIFNLRGKGLANGAYLDDRRYEYVALTESNSQHPHIKSSWDTEEFYVYKNIYKHTSARVKFLFHLPFYYPRVFYQFKYLPDANGATLLFYYNNRRFESQKIKHIELPDEIININGAARIMLLEKTEIGIDHLRLIRKTITRTPSDPSDYDVIIYRKFTLKTVKISYNANGDRKNCIISDISSDGDTHISTVFNTASRYCNYFIYKRKHTEHTGLMIKIRPSGLISSFAYVTYVTYDNIIPINSERKFFKMMEIKKPYECVFSAVHFDETGQLERLYETAADVINDTPVKFAPQNIKKLDNPAAAHQQFFKTKYEDLALYIAELISMSIKI